MIGLPAGIRVYLACGVTDMRKGFDGLAAQVQTALELDPHNGAVFVFRGKRGDLLKALMWDGQGLCRRQQRCRTLVPHALSRVGSGPVYIASGARPGRILSVRAWGSSRHWPDSMWQ